MVMFTIKKIFPIIKTEWCMECQTSIRLQWCWQMTLGPIRKSNGDLTIIETACAKCLPKPDRARAYFESRRLKYGY